MERVLFLLAAAAVVAFAAVAPVPSGAFGWIVVAAAVAAIGLPHGALDTRVARTAFGLGGTRGVAGFVAAYLAAAGVVALLWIAAPVAALCAFLAYAALHFGQDWTKRPATAFLFGAALLAMPALRFEAEVAAIFHAMTGDGAAVAALMHAAAPVLGIAALALAVRQGGAAGGAAVELGAWGAVALAAPPHIAFAVYFAALHSPRHFRETAQDLGLSTREALGAALPWTLPVALVGAGAAAWLAGGGTGAADALARVIFVGLACLTVPHMVLEMIVERPAWREAVRAAIGRSGRTRAARADSEASAGVARAPRR